MRPESVACQVKVINISKYGSRINEIDRHGERDGHRCRDPND